MGCDCNTHSRSTGRHVSIHAPIWGATLYRRDLVNQEIQFQFTHPYGVRRQLEMREMQRENQFQFTHPYGVRRDKTCARNRIERFNSRTHMGCDTFAGSVRCRRLVSIHAPIWGATVKLRKEFLFLKFQFTHPYGVRLVGGLFRKRSIKFQFTHPYGVRPTKVCCRLRLVNVSIHAPIWGATARAK